jgi:uridylate kinase
VPKPHYKRILLKISGQALSDTDGTGVDSTAVASIGNEIRDLQKMGVEIAVVLGGGNFWRFRDQQQMGISRVASDQIGMIATCMNTMVLSNYLNGQGVCAHMYCAFSVDTVIAQYRIFEARRSLEQKKVVLLAGGTGSPFFTTDSAAALRAAELNCDVLLKATKVDGVYDSDPQQNPNAIRFTELSFGEALEKGLEVMDMTAFSLCNENHIPVIVYNGFIKGNMKKIIQGEKVGTFIH